MRLDGLLSSRCRTASYIRFDFDLETKLGTEVFRNLDLPDFWIFSRRPFEEWWSVSGSNRRPQACKASALPTELTPRSPLARRLAFEELVGLGRFELPTSRLSSARSNQLSYEPVPEGRSLGVSDESRHPRTGIAALFRGSGRDAPAAACRH